MQRDTKNRLICATYAFYFMTVWDCVRMVQKTEYLDMIIIEIASREEKKLLLQNAFFPYASWM